ncbi:gdp-fucose protein o-fucosyltransferase 1 [Phtheirospermum japonicum]|uniref:O-fucosyltransferase family protein n=1 Tax=Phtheirospermum japonicum TaxID=374723 RepID=A0A830BQ99_9LAMI|nr:gdp-fucose protein o-fucosyltransferase 1 [Phtheirospermum japonicum]
MNRTLLMPSLSASLFYKEVDLLKPISFDKVFQFEKFNSLCNGFVQLARYTEVSNITNVFELQKGSGRKWTVDKDLMQLRQKNLYDGYEIVRIVGKNPFLWHDHWPVKDYAKVFECLVLVEEISREADKPYVAVHMRIEKDWMIHCRKLEQRLNVSEICSSKEQIIERVGNILGLKTPTVVYLAVADDLLEDDTIMAGWADGLVPYEKKKLGVLGIYEKHPYLIRSAIDYEVCLRSDVFVGNSFSTFSSLVVLDRTQKMVTGESKGSPRSWAANMSDLSLRAISYGSNHISCRDFFFFFFELEHKINCEDITGFVNHEL